ncbi:IclR family transcriptional regulator [Natronobeatus ordinarius]|uniref:IclR family transcriptional regulator n=1 Tax=Natronobeatus ordinarius TaxID=2963433 RepID=UPI0020CBE905|nr:IclR family transcriptional regulator [Natronobeatus ordinarius]
MDDDGTIKSVVKAFEIVESLSRHGGLTASDLATELDLPVSTAHNYLNSLTQTGFVVRDDLEYRPSTKFLEIGERRRQRMAVVRAAESELPKLAATTGEHISLMIEENGLGVLISLDEGEEAINIDAFRGVRMPLHTVAPGKAILAELPHARVDAILDQHGLERMTKNTITDRDELYEELERTRERGYAIDDGERMSGMTCIAAPVLDMNDEVRASVCVCSPSYRIDDEESLEEVARAVQRSANVVQVNLDYS